MLTVTEAREHLDTELGDEALERLLVAAYQDIADYAGTATSVSELLMPGSGELLRLSRRATAVTSVIERGTALADDDYQLRAQTLERLATGTHPSSRWHGRVDVTYTPFDDEDRRDQAALALVRLDLNHNPGLMSQSLGAWSETYQNNATSSDYPAQRAAILATLDPPDFYPV